MNKQLREQLDKKFTHEELIPFAEKELEIHNAKKNIFKTKGKLLDHILDVVSEHKIEKALAPSKIKRWVTKNKEKIGLYGSLASIIGLTLYFLPSNTFSFFNPNIKKAKSEEKIGFCDNEQNTNSILFLPFNHQFDENSINSDCQSYLIEELFELKNTYNLPLEIKKLTSHKNYPNGDAQNAIDIGRNRCANIVVWGNCNEVKGNTTAKIRLSILESNYFKGVFSNYETSFFRISDAIEHNQGNDTTLNKIAFALGALGAYYEGDYNKAYDLSSKIKIEDLGNDCESIDNYIFWARFFVSIGKGNKAATLTHKAMNIAEENICSRLQKANLYDQLSSIYSAQFGNHEKAIDYSKDAINIVKNLKENNDSLLAILYTNLASAYFLNSQYEPAILELNKSLKLFTQSTLKSNYNDLSLSIMFFRMSLINRNKGNYSLALNYADTALQLQLNVIPTPYKELASTYSNFSQIYWHKGNQEKAIQFQKKALDMRKAILPKNHPELGQSYHDYAVITNNNYLNIDEALLYEKKALNIFQSQSRIDSGKVAKVHKQLFTIYKNFNELEKGKSHLDTAFSINLQLEENNRLAFSNVFYYNDYTFYYFAKDDFNTAVEKIDSAILILINLAPDRASLLYNNKAALLAKIGDCQNSIELASKALEILRSSELPPSHYLYYDSYLTIADAHYCQDNFEDANNYVNRVISYYDTLSDNSLKMDLRHAEAINLLAKVKCKLGNRNEAINLNNQAINLIDNRFPNGYFLIRRFKEDMADMQQASKCTLND